MKTIMKIVLTVSALLCLNMASVADPIKIKVNLTDNCNGTWTQPYTVRVQIYVDGILECEDTKDYNPSDFVGFLDFICDEPLPYDAYNPIYQIKVQICRKQTPPCQCYGEDRTDKIHYDDLYTNPQTLDITLTD